MLMLLCIVLAVFAAKLRKGKLIYIYEAFKCIWLPISAGILQAADTVIYSLSDTLIQHIPCFMVSYALLFVFLILNLKYILGSLLTLVGTLLNFIVIFFNNFRMPVAYHENLAGTDLGVGYYFADSSTVMDFLGDIIVIPIPYIGGMISIGDIFICTGIALLIYCSMLSNPTL